ncbi:MAG: D-2-hydroxyacid dehydrogenase [Oscillospiraceae bacterium]|nr:D-2-hydroxyacid dehydrogenase [Oscillospiraceae bacterium]
MNIVILDGYTLNPGDLSWANMQALGNCTIFDYTPAELTVERAKDAEIVISNKTLLGADVINALPKLQYIGLLSTGYNVVDLAAARARSVPVTNIPAYGTASVAQHAFALLLELCAHAGKHSESVHAGEWAKSRDFCYWKTPVTELAGKTMAIIGYGAIGRATAEIARAFGMHVLHHSRSSADSTPLDDLLAASDVISLHCPLTDETNELINATTIAKMKPGALLINTARGPILHEQDVADALFRGQLGGVGVDVLSTEPPASDNPLLGAKNCVITPHIAWASHEARGRLLAIAVDNVRAFLQGKPQNVVN